MDRTSSALQTTPVHEWVGICAQDKGINDIFIEVTVPELVPALTGAISSTTAEQSVSIMDIDGSPINSTVTTKTSITAYYHGNSTNRTFPPDVVQGEQVRVIRYANSDKYYWESMGRDDGLRKTETYRVESKNRKNFTDPTDDAHTYSLELDTKRNQHIRLLTSTGNGEQHTYVLLIDAKNSKVQLSDEIGNAVTIDSNNAKVIVQNSKQAFMMLNGLDAIFAAPRDVTVKAGRQMVINSPLITMQNDSGAGVLAINSNAISIAASSNIVMQSPAMALVGAVQIPNILTVQNLRATIIAEGTVSGTYSAASINIGGGTGIVPGVTPDTTMPSGERHAVSWEQFNAAMTIVVNCFNSIHSSIGVPTAQSGITPLQTSSEMPDITGT